MSKSAKTWKMAQKWPKMSQNAHYLTVIRQHLTLFNFKKGIQMHAK